MHLRKVASAIQSERRNISTALLVIGFVMIGSAVSVGRVQEGQLDGSKTVRILPVTPDGAGGYAVIVRTDDGWLGVSSDGLTEDDSDRILSDLIPRLTG